MSAKVLAPTRADIAAWRRLVSEVRRSVADLSGSTGDLSLAERRARKAIVIGVVERSNPCILLNRAARQFIDATLRQRRELVERLEELAGIVEQALPPKGGELQPQPPAVRRRRDLDD